MPTIQDKIFNSFKELIDENVSENKNIVNDMLKSVIQLSIKKERNENIQSNIKASVNNFIELNK